MQTKIKRKNVRIMTWIAMIVLVISGLRVVWVGVPESSSGAVSAFLYILGGLVFGYAGLSLGADTFNMHSMRKHEPSEADRENQDE